MVSIACGKRGCFYGSPVRSHCGCSPEIKSLNVESQEKRTSEWTKGSDGPLDNDFSNRRPTDSPWLWLGIFIVGALAALVLTAPKFSWRQPQIERQFQARERSGHAVSAAGGYAPLSTTSTMLTLRPLLLFFASALVLSTIAFWIHRFLRMRSTLISPDEMVSDSAHDPVGD